jgi:hypothetical protein
MPKGQAYLDYPEFSNSAKFPIVVSQKSLTVWSRETNHQEAERVIYRSGF